MGALSTWLDNSLFRTDPLFESLDGVWEKLSPKGQRDLIRETTDDQEVGLYFFAKYVLGYWWLCWEPHYEFAKEIQRDINLSLFLLPRGHCKTQIFCHADGIRRYLRDPTSTIGIFSDTLKRAKRRLSAIGAHFENNDILRAAWPERVWPDRRPPRGVKWSPNADGELNLPGHEGGEDPTFAAHGLDHMPTGAHPRIIKGDDLVTVETTTNRDQIIKNIDNFGLVRSSILPPGGNLQVCGTIYDDGDLHRIMEDSGQYRTYKRPCSSTPDDPTVPEPRLDKGVPLWTVQFGIEELRAKRDDPTVSNYIFSCQYLLDPAPEDERAYFKVKEWFTERWTAKTLPKHLKYYVGQDCALGEKDDNDYTVIVVFGLAPDGKWYWVDTHRFRGDSMEIVNLMLWINADKHPGLWGLEWENITKSFGPWLEREMRDHKNYINLEKLPPAGKDLVFHARSFQAMCRSGSVILPAKGETDWLEDAEYEMRKFPRAKHDDIISAAAKFAQAVNLQYKPLTEQEKQDKLRRLGRV